MALINQKVIHSATLPYLKSKMLTNLMDDLKVREREKKRRGKREEGEREKGERERRE